MANACLFGSCGPLSYLRDHSGFAASSSTSRHLTGQIVTCPGDAKPPVELSAAQALEQSGPAEACHFVEGYGFHALLSKQLLGLQDLLMTEHGRELSALKQEIVRLQMELRKVRNSDEKLEDVDLPSAPEEICLEFAEQAGAPRESHITLASTGGCPSRHSSMSMSAEWSEEQGDSKIKSSLRSSNSIGKSSRRSGSPKQSDSRSKSRRVTIVGSFKSLASQLRHVSSQIAMELHPMFRSEIGELQLDANQTPATLHWLNARRTTIRSTVRLTDMNDIRAGDELVDIDWRARLFGCLVSHPLRVHRIIYDGVCMLVLCYDMIVLPLELSGLLPVGDLMAWITTVWWTTDLFLGFFRGFQELGVVEMRVTKTAAAYLKSWFILDFVLVLVEWVIIMMTAFVAFSSVVRTAKALRFWRAIRMFKFLRFYRASHMWSKLRMTLKSDLGQTALSIFGWIVGILALNHITACIWYLLGASAVDSSWVKRAIASYEQHSGQGPNAGYLYATALHWATTQFTPASMEVVPQNTAERIFAILTLFGSLILFPSLLSSITNTVASFRKKNVDYIEARSNLVRFLEENRVSLDLSSKIQSVVFTQYDHIRSAERMHEPEVMLLGLLPRSLKEQMHTEIYQPIVCQHPFMDAIGSMHEFVLHQICHLAMSMQSLSTGQDLFTYGKEAEEVYFVTAGQLLYFEGIEVRRHTRIEVAEGSWVCDQALWVNWVHRGLMTAGMPCELALLNAAIFRQIVHQRPMINDLCCKFASQLLEMVRNGSHGQRISDIGFSAHQISEGMRLAGWVAERGSFDSQEC